MTISAANLEAINGAGYSVVSSDSPAIRCTFSPLETFAAPDWDSLAYYASDYELCFCGEHQA